MCCDPIFWQHGTCDFRQDSLHSRIELIAAPIDRLSNPNIFSTDEYIRARYVPSMHQMVVDERLVLWNPIEWPIIRIFSRRHVLLPLFQTTTQFLTNIPTSWWTRRKVCKNLFGLSLYVACSFYKYIIMRWSVILETQITREIKSLREKWIKTHGTILFDTI